MGKVNTEGEGEGEIRIKHRLKASYFDSRIIPHQTTRRVHLLTQDEDPKEEAQADPEEEAKDSDDEESDSDDEIEVTFDNSPPIVEDTPTGDVFQHEEETYHFDKPNLIVYKKSEVFGYAIKVASRKKLVLLGYMVVETIIEDETDCECILSNVGFTLTDGKWVVPKKTKK